MKKFVTIITLLFLCGQSFAQIYTPVTPSVYGRNENRNKSLLVLHLPERDQNAINQTLTNDTTAQIFYNKVDQTVWAYSKARGFFQVGGGSGGTPSQDSAFIAINCNSHTGYVVYEGGLNFRSTYINYNINCRNYSSAPTNVTLDPAEELQDRTDYFVVDTFGVFGVIKGDPGGLEPQIDPAKHRVIAIAEIPAGSSVPSNVSNVPIYQENIEWVGTSNISGINFAWGSVPINGLVSTYIPTFSNGDWIRYTSGSVHDLTEISYLRFDIKINGSAWRPNNKDFISLRFSKDGISRTGYINLIDGAFGFDRTKVGITQTIVIPKSVWAYQASDFNELYIYHTGSASYRIDDIFLQKGGEPFPSPGGGNQPNTLAGDTVITIADTMHRLVNKTTGNVLAEWDSYRTELETRPDDTCLFLVQTASRKWEIYWNPNCSGISSQWVDVTDGIDYPVGNVNVTGIANHGYRLNTTFAGPNWAIGTGDQAYGDFFIRRSNAYNGNPFASGSNVLYADPVGRLGFNTFNATIGDGTYGTHFVSSNSPSNGSYIVLRKPNTTNFNQGIYFQDKSSIAGWISGVNAGGSYFIGHGSGANETSSITDARLKTDFIVDPGGNVGIGTGSPVSKLSVSGAVAYDSLHHRIIIYDGDSYSTSANWPTYLPYWSDYFAKAGFLNYATSGHTTSDVISSYSAGPALSANTEGFGEYFYSIYAGVNDLATGTSGTTVYNNLKTIWSNARSNGYKVIAFTVIHSTFMDAGEEAQRIILNNLIVSDRTLYEHLVDVASQFDPRLDPSLFVDETHLTASGYNMFASMVAKSIERRPFDLIPAGDRGSFASSFSTQFKGAIGLKTVTTAQMDLIPNPRAGYAVINSDSSYRIFTYDGTVWKGYSFAVGGTYTPPTYTEYQVPYTNSSGALVGSNQLTWNGTTLNVGYAGFGGTNNLYLNDGRAYISATGNGMTMGTSGGFPVDASKRFNWLNSGYEYGKFHSTGTGYADWKHHFDIYTQNVRIRSLGSDSTQNTPSGTVKLVTTDANGLLGHTPNPLPASGSLPEYPDNATAVAAIGLGKFYRTGDFVKVTH